MLLGDPAALKQGDPMQRDKAAVVRESFDLDVEQLPGDLLEVEH